MDKEILTIILDSNAIAVLIGGIVSLGTLYLTDIFKYLRRKSEDRKIIYFEIRKLGKEMYRNTVLVHQLDLLHSRNKRLFELKQEEEYKNEEKRRLLQLEEYKEKFLSLEGDWERIYGKCVLHFKRDKTIKGLFKKIDDFEDSDFSSFDHCNTENEVLEEYKKMDKETTKHVDEGLNKHIIELIKHLEKKVS